MDVTHKRIASAPSDLFTTLHEQAERVLGKISGFYVVIYDDARDQARVPYLSVNGKARTVQAHWTLAECDALRERCTLINDEFATRLADDVVNSICVPMIRNGAVLGAFGAFTNEPRDYDTRDALALVAIAELGALALENVTFVAQLEKARREAERLEEIGRALTASLSLDDVLRTVVDAALELAEADGATVWLLRGEHEVEAAMTAGEISPPRGFIMQVPPSLRHQMADLRRAFVHEDANQGRHEPTDQLRSLTAARSTMAVSLIAGETVLGALVLGHRERRRYYPEDVRLVERLSFQAAIAVANARMHEQIIGLSLTDPLTRLPNRRHLELYLEKEFAAARRGRRLSCIIFDLDNFKGYNDSAGHQAGDEVLGAFGEVLTAQTRAMNLAARYGGDEFITILADADRQGALKHAERIAEAVESHPLLQSAGVRASAGVGTYEPNMKSPAELIRAADNDLYARKAVRRAIGNTNRPEVAVG